MPPISAPTGSPARNVGTVFVDVTDQGDEDRAHFRAELAEECYAQCDFRPFTGEGGFEHIYGDGDTAREAVLDLVKVLQSVGLTGVVRVRS